MPAAPSSPSLCVVDDSDPLVGELADVPPAPVGWLEMLAQVPDSTPTPRGARSPGRGARGGAGRHPGRGGLVHCDRRMGRRCRTRRTGRTGCGRRATERVDHPPLPAAAGPDPSVIDGRRVIAFDGKTLRGARDAAGNVTHLLAGLCQRTGAVIAQLGVGCPHTPLRGILPEHRDAMPTACAVLAAFTGPTRHLRHQRAAPRPAHHRPSPPRHPLTMARKPQHHNNIQNIQNIQNHRP